MIEKAIKGIVDAGRAELTRLQEDVQGVGKRAAAEVARALAEIDGLIKLAEDVNVKTLERFQGLLTTEFPVYRFENGANPFFVLQVDHGGHHALRGVVGPGLLEPGKYRALLLIERVGPLEDGR